MEYRGPSADIEIPDCSLYELLFESLDEHSLGLVAFDHAETGQVVTFGELRDQVDAIATWLVGNGLAVGDVVSLMLHNRPEFAACFHGVLRAGGTVTPVNTAASPHEVARQLHTTSARMVVTSPAELEQVRAALELGEHRVETLVVIELPAELEPTGGLRRVVDLSELLSTPPAPPRIDIDPATHVACMPVSSGTSGIPKAVMLSHRNLGANMLQFTHVLDALDDPHQSLVSFLPWSHIYALTTNMNFGLFRRFTQYTMSAFQPALFATIMTTRRPSLLFVVPPVATLLVRSPKLRQLPWESVQLVVSGAAPLDGPVGEALQERFGTRVIQGYGMTELSPVSHVTPIPRRDIGMDTIGLAIPNVVFRVVDPDTGQDVEHPEQGQWSSPGELWVKGPNTMLGYLGRVDDTEAVKDADGFVHTGDLVQVDHEGVVRVVDRIKELIKRRGFQVPPAELEALLVTHPSVLDAAVLGIARSDGDETPHALLVLAPEADPLAAPEEVLHWANDQVAAYKRLGGATVVAQLPRSAAGKILRRELPALLD